MVMLVERAQGRPSGTRLGRRRFFLVFVALLGLMVGRASAEPVRIMPLGDSITAGYVDNVTWKTPFTFGYRGPLYTRLAKAGYDFQFVGASPEPWDGVLGVPKKVRGPDLRRLKQDRHRGYGGTVFSHLVNGLPKSDGGIANWLKTDKPDIVLLMMGINNIAYFGNTGNPADVENELKSLVQTIVDALPDAHVVVAQIAPYQTGVNTDSVTQYNNYIKNTLAPHFADQGKHVTTVDQYSNFVNPNGRVAAGLYSGLAHPNVAGYERMAETWFRGLQSIMPKPEPKR